MLNPEKKAIVSLVLGIVSLLPFTAVILISKFFWSISISNDLLMFFFFAAVLCGGGGLFLGNKGFKIEKRVSIISVIATILSVIGIVISLYFLYFFFYLGQF